MCSGFALTWFPGRRRSKQPQITSGANDCQPGRINEGNTVLCGETTAGVNVHSHWLWRIGGVVCQDPLLARLCVCVTPAQRQTAADVNERVKDAPSLKTWARAA